MALDENINLKLPVLIVEDEAYIATEIEALLKDLGFETIETCMSLADAEKMVRSVVFGLAVIDLNLNGTLSFSLINDAVARGLAVVTMSGYLPIQEELRDTAFLPKPVRPGALSAAISSSYAKAKEKSVISAPKVEGAPVLNFSSRRLALG